jgi:uncharacterized protein HemX
MILLTECYPTCFSYVEDNSTSTLIICVTILLAILLIGIFTYSIVKEIYNSKNEERSDAANREEWCKSREANRKIRAAREEALMNYVNTAIKTMAKERENDDTKKPITAQDIIDGYNALRGISEEPHKDNTPQ